MHVAKIRFLLLARDSRWLRAAVLMCMWTICACAAETKAGDGDLKVFMQEYLKGNDPTVDQTARFSSATVSLDDKSEMTMVYVTGQDWCGSGGCTAFLVEKDQASFKVIQKFTLVRLPIHVLSSKANGWHDITMLVQGGGEAGRTVVLRYNGTKYPSNPSTAPTLKAESSSDLGYELLLPRVGEVLYP